MNVTIQAATLDNWQHAGTAAKLRIFALRTFKSAEGLIVTGAVNPATDWYREINCTVGSRTDGTGATIRTLSIPALELPSTTDSDAPDVRYYALWADDAGRALQQWFGFEYFSLPATSPTTWAAIRAFNVLPAIPPANWQQSVLDLIAANAGQLLNLIAGQALSALRVVRMVDGSAVYANSSDASQAGQAVGVTTQAAASGAVVSVRRDGRMSDSSWNWTYGNPVYFNSTGALTQTPPSTGFVQVVGFPLGTTELIVGFEQPILR